MAKIDNALAEAHLSFSCAKGNRERTFSFHCLSWISISSSCPAAGRQKVPAERSQANRWNGQMMGTSKNTSPRRRLSPDLSSSISSWYSCQSFGIPSRLKCHFLLFALVCTKSTEKTIVFTQSAVMIFQWASQGTHTEGCIETFSFHFTSKWIFIFMSINRCQAQLSFGFMRRGKQRSLINGIRSKMLLAKVTLLTVMLMTFTNTGNRHFLPEEMRTKFKCGSENTAEQCTVFWASFDDQALGFWQNKTRKEL